MSGWWRSLTPGSRTLRVVVLLAPAGSLLLTAIGGPAPRLLLLALVVLLGAAGAVRPESPLLAVALGLVACWWALVARAEVPATAVPAAWLLLAAHLAATVLGYGPPELGLDPAVRRLWARRGLLLALAPPAVWGLARALAGRPEPAAIWAGGLLAAAAVCVLGAVAAFTPGARDPAQTLRSATETRRSRWM